MWSAVKHADFSLSLPAPDEGVWNKIETQKYWENIQWEGGILSLKNSLNSRTSSKWNGSADSLKKPKNKVSVDPIKMLTGTLWLIL